MNRIVGEKMSIKINVKGSIPKVDSWEIPIICPKCGAQNKVTIAQIKREETIECKGCGTKTNLIDEEGNVKTKTQTLQRSLDDLERTLRKLGAKFR